MQKYFEERMLHCVATIFIFTLFLCVVVYVLTGCAQFGITEDDTLISAEEKLIEGLEKKTSSHPGMKP